MADEEEALRSMLSLNFYHAVFHLTPIPIPHPSQLLTVLGVYRSPTSPEADDEQIIRAIRLVANQPGIFLGDFNAPHINWQSGSCSALNGLSLKLFEVAEQELISSHQVADQV